jgi:alpha(1,3/1,4) fucosyltransferase
LGEPKHIVSHLYGNADTVLFGVGDRDNVTEPYVKFKRRCEELGYICEGTKDQKLDDCRWLLFWDCASLGQWRYRIKARLRGYPTRNLFKEAVQKGMQDRLALFMYEPPLVCPENYDFELHKHFAVIFTWDPTLVDGKKYHRIYLPSSTEFPPVHLVPFAQKKLLVNISSHKHSRYERELYSEIRRTIRFFEQSCPDHFDLYGFLWNPSVTQHLRGKIVRPWIRREVYPSYRGVARDKWGVYPNYRFGLCYENSVEPGYVSLKIFDCLRCGCVPVYLGAPDIANYVDKDAFVDRRDFSSLQSLADYLRGVDERVYHRYIEAGQAYLGSDKFKLFLSESFVDTVVNALRIDDRVGRAADPFMASGNEKAVAVAQALS